MHFNGWFWGSWTLKCIDPTILKFSAYWKSPLCSTAAHQYCLLPCLFGNYTTKPSSTLYPTVKLRYQPSLEWSMGGTESQVWSIYFQVSYNQHQIILHTLFHSINGTNTGMVTIPGEALSGLGTEIRSDLLKMKFDNVLLGGYGTVIYNECLGTLVWIIVKTLYFSNTAKMYFMTSLIRPPHYSDHVK